MLPWVLVNFRLGACEVTPDACAANLAPPVGFASCAEIGTARAKRSNAVTNFYRNGRPWF